MSQGPVRQVGCVFARSASNFLLLGVGRRGAAEDWALDNHIKDRDKPKMASPSSLQLITIIPMHRLYILYSLAKLGNQCEVFL